ncbi:MAG: hypothetical protein HY655_14240, partial [Acidobacteria bacterium]|nr:hypothetical protein [Acidobacteriota bacterium]
MPTSAADRRQGLRAALFRTLPGRAIVIGLAIKLSVALIRFAAGSVPAFLGVVDTVAGAAIAAGATYFIVRLLMLAKRRLLWRVRRKLILSYIFIGFVPAILIVGFFLLCGFLLLYNFSSYLVQSRLRALSDQARFIAQSTAAEIQRDSGRDVGGVLARRQAGANQEFPGASLAVVPVDRPCAQIAATAGERPAQKTTALATAGPWTHVEPVRDLPPWVDCAGFSGVLAYAHRHGGNPPQEDTHMVLRAVAFPESPAPGYSVIVDLPLGDAVRQQLQRETGVELKSVSVVPNPRVVPLKGLPVQDPEVRADRSTSGLLNNLGSLMEYHDWSSGETGTLLVSTRLSVM